MTAIPVRLDRLPDRITVAARLAASAATLRLLAAGGDPVARLLAGAGRGDVYVLHERVRARGPLTRSRTGLLAVTSHDLCDSVLRDPRFGVQGGAAGGDAVAAAAEGPLAGSFLDLDPPDHTRLRRLVAPAFRPRLVRGYAERIEAVVTGLVDRVATRDSFDLVADVATPLPVAVISELLGIPDADTARFAEIGMVAGRSLDGVTSLRQADRLRAAGDELAELFTRLARERRAAPADDVISLLAAAEADARVTAGELLATCGLLLVAGFETTVNLIGNGVAALLADRSLWRRLAAEPALADRAVEETLRYDPPVQLTSRVAREPVELAGQAVPAGTVVLVDLAAAGRDPQAHRDPARFDPDRSGEPEHLAFSSGIHHCLGAPLARLEGAIVLRVLARRLPGLHRLPGATRRRGATIRGFRTLPVATRP